LGQSLHLGTESISVTREEGGYVVTASGPNREERVYRTKHLITGMDHLSACRFLERLAPEVVALLKPIESVSLAVVNVGFDLEAFPTPPEGFGFLVPKTEKDVPILGALWSSSVFPHHAPTGCLGLRIFSGGVRSPEWVDLPEEILVEKSLSELSRFVEIKAPPKTVFVSRYRHAVPQMVP